MSEVDSHPQETLIPRKLDGVRRRIVKGLGANLLNKVIILGTRVLLVPLFLRAWGVEVYGEWLVLFSLVSYLTLTDMGGQLYVTNRLTQAFAQNNVQEFREVLHTGLALFLTLPIIVFLLLVTAIAFFPPLQLLQIRITDPQIGVTTLIVLSFQVVLALPGGILLGAYRASGLLSRGVMLYNAILVLQMAFIALGLWFGAGMVGIATLNASVYVIVGGISLWDLRRLHPEWHVLTLHDARPNLVKSFVKPSAGFLLIQTSQIFPIQGTLLIVAAILGPVQVVIFSTVRTLAHLIKQMVSTIAATVWPELTRLDAEGRDVRAVVLFQAVLRSTMVVSVGLAAGLHFGGAFVYRWWLGDQVEFNQAVLDLFLGHVMLTVFWTVCSNYLMAVNQHQQVAWILAVTSVLSLVFASVGAQIGGVSGAIVGMAVSEGALAVWAIPVVLHRYQKVLPKMFFIQETIPIVVGTVMIMLVKWTTPFVLAALCVWCAIAVFKAGWGVRNRVEGSIGWV